VNNLKLGESIGSVDFQMVLPIMFSLSTSIFQLKQHSLDN